MHKVLFSKGAAYQEYLGRHFFSEMKGKEGRKVMPGLVTVLKQDVPPIRQVCLPT